MPETTLTKISDHVYWMTPGKPDRPSLCAVVGTQHTLMLDAGASAAHARRFLNALRAEGVAMPHYVALTHWHWDHIFGAAELAIPVIAHALTAERIAEQVGYEWSDAALDQRVAIGAARLESANNIKIELPAPRNIRIVAPDIVFETTLDIHLGGVACHIEHVGGDHASDSCVMRIEPDGVLFLGDCLYDAIYAPVRHYTTKYSFPLMDTLLKLDAETIIEGHTPIAWTRLRFAALCQKMRLIGTLVGQIGADEAAVLAEIKEQTGQSLDEDTEDFVRGYIAGRQFE